MGETALASGGDSLRRFALLTLTLRVIIASGQLSYQRIGPKRAKEARVEAVGGWPVPLLLPSH